MNLQQSKLTKKEWVSIERPVSDDEITILKIISEGYNNPKIINNNTLTLQHFLKVDRTKNSDMYIFSKYIQPDLITLYKKYNITYKQIKCKDKTIKKSDIIRFQNAERKLKESHSSIFEFILLELIKDMIKYLNKDKDKWLFYYYTLSKLITYKIDTQNQTFKEHIHTLLEDYRGKVCFKKIIKMSPEILENNPFIYRFSDLSLYEHQKKLFTVCKHPGPKLISYIAPTGTGKTLSPIGLISDNVSKTDPKPTNKVIFLCAARHIGLALAKSAISMGKKIAFAFNCNDIEDIRLHYFAAKDYIKNRKTGGIFKVDNSVGDKVEMIISDIKSYIYAMHYMLAFNESHTIITYWDEPTITLDYEEHEYHALIKKNWQENLIPNMVLSSATLPLPQDTRETFMDFRSKFNNASEFAIISSDCKKSVKLIDKDGHVKTPHNIATDFDNMKTIVQHCKELGVLSRYIDIESISGLILHLIKNNCVEKYSIDTYYEDLLDISIEGIKNHYLDILSELKKVHWTFIDEYREYEKTLAYKSTVHIVTKDAHTLTCGPTIFLARDISKVAKIYLKEADMPVEVVEAIISAINYNDMINKRISSIEKDIEDIMGDVEDSSEYTGPRIGELRAFTNKINELKAYIQPASVPMLYVPNSKEHMERYIIHDQTLSNKVNAFTSDISDDIVEEIMLLNDVEVSWKILLLLGIGVFAEHKSIKYTEIIKRLAEDQRLYLIIATDDYIYGTNYQFCHGYLGKDLLDMSQEKCIQALGRVGRGKQEQVYTFRFRENKLIERLFFPAEEKPEVENMRRLFNS